MQIQAGLYKGRRVKTVKNAPYRPTASTVRKSLFDILGNLKGKCVLDLFAGSGIVGFEAASRGASTITFVESSMRVNSLLKINGSLFKQTDFKYIKQDATRFITKCGDYDIIFADPPYDFEYINYEKVVQPLFHSICLPLPFGCWGSCFCRRAHCGELGFF